MLRSPRISPLLALLVCGACAPAAPPAAEPDVVAAPLTAQDAFWANLERHCGRAFPGRLIIKPPGDEMLAGTEPLVVHFRECGRDTLKLPFHVQRPAPEGWDRSRTWNFIRTATGLELRHDHRHEDGTPHAGNWYGGHTVDEGAPDRQEFVFAERRAADGSLLGWRVEIVPEERYTYGTIRGGEWTWRVDFDLTSPVAPPPAPWGHEEG